jgi:uncharacterized protein YndB with AHSA1/START domain
VFRAFRASAERLIDQPADVVFARYTDHAGWSGWAGLGPVRLLQEGAGDRNGVGAVRGFALAPGLREQVTRFEPSRRLEYKICAGGFPIADHRGEVVFTPDGERTLVAWSAGFRSKIPGVGGLMERGISAMFRSVLVRLAQDLRARPPL